LRICGSPSVERIYPITGTSEAKYHFGLLLTQKDGRTYIRDRCNRQAARQAGLPSLVDGNLGVTLFNLYNSIFEGHFGIYALTENKSDNNKSNFIAIRRIFDHKLKPFLLRSRYCTSQTNKPINRPVTKVMGIHSESVM
jgi:hypothetical protein